MLLNVSLLTRFTLYYLLPSCNNCTGSAHLYNIPFAMIHAIQRLPPQKGFGISLGNDKMTVHITPRILSELVLAMYIQSDQCTSKDRDTQTHLPFNQLPYKCFVNPICKNRIPLQHVHKHGSSSAITERS